MDWFLGVLISALLFCLVGLGFSLGRDSAASDCRDFGAFIIKDQRYVCNVEGVAK